MKRHRLEMAIAMTVGMLTTALPMDAGAEQLQIGLSTVTGYASNIFGQPSGAERTGSIHTLRGSLSLDGERSLWRYGLRYQPQLSGRGNQLERRNVGHQGTLDVNVTPAPRTRLRFSSRVFNSQDFRLDLDDFTSTGEEATESSIIVTRLWNTFDASYQLAPRWVVAGTARHNEVLFDSDNQSDNSSLAGTLSSNYTVGPRLRVGAGGSFTFRSFSDRASIAGLDATRSRSVEGFASFFFQVTSTISLSAQAGPALLLQSRAEDLDDRQLQLDNQAFTNPTATRTRFPSSSPNASDPPGTLSRFFDRALCDLSTGIPSCLGTSRDDLIQVDDSVFQAAGFGSVNEAVGLPALSDFDDQAESVTYFAAVALQKEFRKGSVAVNYTRSEQPNGGNSVTSIFDTVSVSGSVGVGARWRLDSSFYWSRSELQQFGTELSPNSVYPSLGITGTSINNGANREILVVERIESRVRLDSNLISWRARAGVERRFDRKLRVGARFEFQRREVEGDVSSTTLNDYRGIVTLNYTWDPVRL